MKMKEIRKAKGITQRQLSELTGISIGSIKSYEQGLRQIEKANIVYILKICEALDCKLEDLM